MRAAVRGVIDFSKARIHDVRWWRRANALIKTMAAEDATVVIRAAFDLQRSLVGNSGLETKSFEDAQKRAKEFFNDLVDTTHPWAATESKLHKDSTTNSVIEMYKHLVGDPDDPEFRAKLLQDYERLQNPDASAAPAETDNERIDRLTRERNAKFATR